MELQFTSSYHINEISKLDLENKELKIENEILKQQQCEQDEILIENAFAIANIELRGLHNV